MRYRICFLAGVPKKGVSALVLSAFILSSPFALQPSRVRTLAGKRADRLPALANKPRRQVATDKAIGPRYKYHKK